ALFNEKGQLAALAALSLRIDRDSAAGLARRRADDPGPPGRQIYRRPIAGIRDLDTVGGGMLEHAVLDFDVGAAVPTPIVPILLRAPSIDEYFHGRVGRAADPLVVLEVKILHEHPLL